MQKTPTAQAQEPTDTITALEQVVEIGIYLSSVQELTQQLVDLADLSGRQDKQYRFNALDFARIATQEKLNSLVNGIEAYLSRTASAQCTRGEAQRA